MSMKQIIIEKLTEEFHPTHLNVIDESELHRGHAGYREGGNSHFRVQISSPMLDGKLRVAQHRAIMDCLAVELKQEIHAFAIEVSPSAG
ncbi:BolA family protein [uncultured Maritalea sp.]|uniref:BolA family protein n=1 Tax=uncultured Maritalea sp. TaxID=757249 RepID=UPI0026122985|nr:BolA family protein [uncultured Maritalea sp.]